MAELSGDLTHSFPAYLRDKSIAVIEARELSRTELAEILHLFPAGVDRIMSQNVWPASLGCRVLEALDVDIKIEAVGSVEP